MIRMISFSITITRVTKSNRFKKNCSCYDSTKPEWFYMLVRINKNLHDIKQSEYVKVRFNKNRIKKLFLVQVNFILNFTLFLKPRTQHQHFQLLY